MQGASDHGVSEAFYLGDPEGNGIEVYIDRPESQWPRNPNGQIEMYTARLDIDDLLSTADAYDGSRRQLPAATDMGHIHFRVSDLNRAGAFYVDALGLNLMMAMGDSALFVATDGYHHQIGLNTWGSRGSAPRPDGALGPSEATLRFELSENDAQNHDRSEVFAGWLESRHVSAVVNEDGAVLVTDPSGNRICFVVM